MILVSHLAVGAKADSEEDVDFVLDNAVFGQSEHTKQDDRTTALLLRQLLVRTYDMPRLALRLIPIKAAYYTYCKLAKVLR